MFDTNAFLNQTVSGPMSTRLKICPEGEYPAVTDEKMEVKTIKTKDGDRHVCSIYWNILDEAVKTEVGRDKVSVRQDIWLDMDERGVLDGSEGKNVGLGRTREALGQNNDPNWTPAKLKNAGPALVKVTHRKDKDSDDVYDEVKKVTAIT